MTSFDDYYTKQAGNGIGQVYAGTAFQRGSGVGSFLSGLFRKALPFLYTGARAVGKEALKSGLGILEDIENNKPVKESVVTRIRSGGSNLKRKAKDALEKAMTGSGYKIKKRRTVVQSKKKRPTVRLPKTVTKKKVKIKDIFCS